MRDHPPPITRPIRVVAQGDAEVQQLIRRMKANAYRVAGGQLMMLKLPAQPTPTAIPLVWIEPAGRAQVERLSAFHHKGHGQAWDVNIDYEWLASGPIVAGQPSNEAIIRLDARMTREDGQKRAISLWFDAHHERIVLEHVIEKRQFLLYADKPTANILAILDTPNIAYTFSATEDLQKFLASTVELPADYAKQKAYIAAKTQEMSDPPTRVQQPVQSETAADAPNPLGNNRWKFWKKR